MTHKLDKILISSAQPDFVERCTKIRAGVFSATHFDGKDEREEQLDAILNDVVQRDDKAVAEYTEKFDGVKLTPEQFRISNTDLEKAHSELKKNNLKLLDSLRQAIANVKKYQEEIFIGNKKQNQHPGIKYTPIKRVGICVPGASAPLPSTVIMTAVPAQVAGVKEIVIVSPPRYNKSIHPVILAVCYELYINKDYQNCQIEVYRIGGAQAVMALARGTKTIRNVDKIVGPGNAWVQNAKKKVLGLVGIDSIAGPSEVLIIGNKKANPAWIAADMLSQAEHAPGSAVVFTDSQELANEILAELKKQVKQLDRVEEIIKCLENFGEIVVFDDMKDIIDHVNVFATEHLEIQCGEQSRKIATKIINAGAIFIGDYSPVAVGDYWAGPSHTLPTGTSARFFSGLTANDFIKSTSIIEYDKEKLAECADDIIRLAEAEGLDAHAKSIKIRQQE
jgi:histidinol dehydrogenase